MLNIVDYGGEGTTLVLLHGFLGSGADWRTVLPALVQHYRCVTVDLPGHGDSRSSAAVTGLVSLAEQIVAALANNGIEYFSLLGYSLGGRVALVIAATFPERVERLFLEGANPGLQSEDERNQRRLQDDVWAKRFRHEPLATVLNDWYQQPVFANMDELARSALVRERSEANNGVQLAEILSCCSLAEQRDYRCFLRSLCTGNSRVDRRVDKSAVVYLVGEYDNKFWLLAHSLERECSVDMHIVTEAGHNTHRDNPADFVRALV